MWKNYFTIGWRNLWRNKVFSMINMAGMAVGIACFVLLALFIGHELSYDRFHAKAERILRVKMIYQHGDGEKVDVALTPTALVPDFQRRFPEIVSGVRISQINRTVQYRDKLFNEREFLYVDPSFFDIFSFTVLSGNPATLLDEPDAAVLTKETAEKYFGEENPVGKLLRVDNSKDLKVTGVVANIPANSQLKFDLLGSFSALAVSKEEKWAPANYVSYLLLSNKKAIGALQAKIDQRTEEMVAQWGEQAGTLRYVLEPLTRVHLYSTADIPAQTGDILYIYILGVVAALQLLIACINFMNLSTARAAERTREIGVRKTMGAYRNQLFKQFISESAVVTFFAFVLGLLAAWIALPSFNHLTGRELSMMTLWCPVSFVLIIGLFVLVTFLAGAYPAFFLSAFRPVTVLGGKQGRAKGNALRKALVIFQFAVSIFFMMATLVISRQLGFIQDRKGFASDQILVINDGPGDKLEAFKNALLQQPGITHMTASYDSPVKIQGGYTIVDAEGKPEDFTMSVTAIPAERDFVKTLGMPLIAGRHWTKTDIALANPDTATRYYPFIINQSAAKALGWRADEAIGKRLEVNGRQGEINGVVKDFHFASMHKAIAPLVIFPEYDYFGKTLIRLSGNNLVSAIGNVEMVWQAFFPMQPFDYHFLEEDFDALYQNERRVRKVFTLFAGLTIFIACLGLFGLAAFATEKRTKEIGIRKVMGASVISVMVLLSRDFIRLVLLAIVIATPIAWYAMNRWLEDFVYRIVIDWWLFVLAGLTAVIIALLTVSFQSVKAALMNPVKSLRSE